jgi:uncharacterized protein GlcG (DUF336 family)
MPRQIWTLTQADASFLIDHVINGAKAIGVAVSVVIVEGGGSTIGLLRMDAAKLASIGVAEGKAWTAAFFQRPSIDYNAPAAPGGGSFGSHLLQELPSPPLVFGRLNPVARLPLSEVGLVAKAPAGLTSALFLACRVYLGLVDTDNCGMPALE